MPAAPNLVSLANFRRTSGVLFGSGDNLHDDRTINPRKLSTLGDDFAATSSGAVWVDSDFMNLTESDP